jgi:hypothetical protein
MLIQEDDCCIDYKTERRSVLHKQNNPRLDFTKRELFIKTKIVHR